jgi:hypothetical protein
MSLTFYTVMYNVIDVTYWHFIEPITSHSCDRPTKRTRKSRLRDWNLNIAPCGMRSMLSTCHHKARANRKATKGDTFKSRRDQFGTTHRPEGDLTMSPESKRHEAKH